jgi:hypothetical protein
MESTLKMLGTYRSRVRQQPIELSLHRTSQLRISCDADELSFQITRHGSLALRTTTVSLTTGFRLKTNKAPKFGLPMAVNAGSSFSPNDIHKPCTSHQPPPGFLWFHFGFLFSCLGVESPAMSMPFRQCDAIGKTAPYHTLSELPLLSRI